MSNDTFHIAQRAFRLADAGNLPEAIALYRQAIGIAEAQHKDTWQLRGELGCVLERAGDLAAARDQREMALGAALGDGGESSLAVAIERYFLGELLLRMQEPADALATIEPSLGEARVQGLLRMVESLAQWQTGHVAEAKVAAQRALDAAQSPGQRERINQRLGEILDDASG